MADNSCCLPFFQWFYYLPTDLDRIPFTKCPTATHMVRITDKTTNATHVSVLVVITLIMSIMGWNEAVMFIVAPALPINAATPINTIVMRDALSETFAFIVSNI
jgi:uncharacterized membrane protein